jgi:hypothetical protein
MPRIPPARISGVLRLLVPCVWPRGPGLARSRPPVLSAPAYARSNQSIVDDQPQHRNETIGITERISHRHSNWHAL